MKFLTEYAEIEAGFIPADRDFESCDRADYLSHCFPGERIVLPRQCHTSNVVAVHDAEQGVNEIPDVDGCITSLSDVILTSSHADCLPIYMYDPVRKVIGVAHSGWKGCLSGIGINMVRLMKAEYGCRPEEIVSYIGPGIGSCCFEVDKDVADDFSEKYPFAVNRYIIKDSEAGKDGTFKYHIDLKSLVCEYLKSEGIRNISVDSHCTCCGGDRFWSHRRNGTPGRHIAYARIK